MEKKNRNKVFLKIKMTFKVPKRYSKSFVIREMYNKQCWHVIPHLKDQYLFKNTAACSVGKTMLADISIYCGSHALIPSAWRQVWHYPPLTFCPAISLLGLFCLEISLQQYEKSYTCGYLFQLRSYLQSCTSNRDVHEHRSD